MTENAIDEWIQNAIPPGSGRYYAILHASAGSQQRLRAIATLASVWSKLCFSNREIEVAQKKLQWWREELNRDNYLHPVTQALSRCGNEHDKLNSIDAALLTLLKDTLEGYGSLLTKGSPSTGASNQQFHHATGANVCLALCNSDLPEAAKKHIRQAGILLSRARCLRHLHKHVSNGLLCLQMADLEARNIKPNQLVPELSADTAIFLSDSVQSLRQEIDACMNDFTGLTINHGSSASDGLKTIFIYLYLQCRLLARVHKDVSLIFQPEIRLSPLGNYWHALRAATRFDRIASVPQSLTDNHR